MPESDRKARYAAVLGAPRWNHATVHCLCDRSLPDPDAMTTPTCRANYDRAVRVHEARLTELLTLVDGEIAAATSPSRALARSLSRAGTTLTRVRWPAAGARWVRQGLRTRGTRSVRLAQVVGHA